MLLLGIFSGVDSRPQLPKWRFRACPRCGGALYLEDKVYCCLQCSYNEEVKVGKGSGALYALKLKRIAEIVEKLSHHEWQYDVGLIQVDKHVFGNPRCGKCLLEEALKEEPSV